MDSTPCKSFQRDDLEITRNPFDSRELDKENLPAFSPSIFVASACRSSEKKNKSFRWSIDQIAALKPADIDEFPNQEYSASYERVEDEIEAQNAINEYFSKVTLPSPWARNKDVAYKRVTFSPNPPTYFREASYDSIKSSKDSSRNTTQNDEEKKFVDCSCQTMITIPTNFDLQKLLGSKCFTYKEPNQNSKELNISTLRRQLFSQGDPSPPKEKVEVDANNNQRTEIKSTTSTPRTPRTPNWVTSSPFRELNAHGTPLTTPASDTAESVLQSSFVADPLNSPVLSPIKDDNADDIALSFTKIDSPDTSFDFSVSSITTSVSRDEKLVSSDLEKSPNDQKPTYHPLDIQWRANTMSVGPSDSVADVKESTRLALVELAGFSPIKHEEEMDISVVSSSKCEFDMRYTGNSVKESTANHIHGITGLFSPINRNKMHNSYNTVDEIDGASMDNVEGPHEASIDDGGPLDITELSLPPDQSLTTKGYDEELANISDDVFQPPVVIVSPYPTPKRGILKHASQRGSALVENRITDTYDYRFTSLEQKISKVEDRIDSVKSHCESDIREIKRSLTPARKPSSCAVSVNYHLSGSESKEINHGKNSVVRFRRENFRPLESTGTRVPLQDRTNNDSMRAMKHPDGYHPGNGSPSAEAIVRKGYSALLRAKTVQRRIDEDFEFCHDDRPNASCSQKVDTDDVEAAEVASILTKKSNARLTREGERIDYFENDAKSYLIDKDKFQDYRLHTIRESLNDSWDLRSKGAMDIGEMDSSMMSSTTADTSTPTPIMNLAGLSIYNVQRESTDPMNLPRPIQIDRKWTKDSGKIERRHTWPGSRPTRYISLCNIRTSSPPSTTRGRSSKSSFAKLDVSKIKEEFKSRPSSRAGFISISR